MATTKRAFRGPDSYEAEHKSRDAVKPFLESRGYLVLEEARRKVGEGESQIVAARSPDGQALRMRVRLCWRRDGRRAAEKKYSAAQLRARLIDGDWNKTLDSLVARDTLQKVTHTLLLQCEAGNVIYAALVPTAALKGIWLRQREVSDILIKEGAFGRRHKNHAANGESPTLWLLDDREPRTHEVADALWNWPGVIDVVKLPQRVNAGEDDDTRAWLNKNNKHERDEMARPLLFCNIGWMEHYQGQTDTDRLKGGGQYTKDYGRGEETCNFVPSQGRVFGYVQPVGTQIKLEHLGGAPSDEKLEGVDVVVTAPHPAGGTVVVGWFKSATVFRNVRDLPYPTAVHVREGIKTYRYEAATADVTLLRPDERSKIVPRGKGWMGTSNVWYAREAPDDWLGEIRLMLRGGASASRKARRRTQPDAFWNAKVEKAAMKFAAQYFEDLDYAIRDVSKENLGWDIEAHLPAHTLRVEVKGLSGDGQTIELTPNEYKAFVKCEQDYRLCIVSNALSVPSMAICRYREAVGRWVTDSRNGEDAGISVKERVAAVISIA